MPSLDEDFLRHAIDLAKTARQGGEYPFGAILVVNQQLVHQATDHCMTYTDLNSQFSILNS
jgi:tRNA(Arg) A34 adenosine deaminase TadA